MTTTTTASEKTEKTPYNTKEKNKISLNSKKDVAGI